MFLVLPLLSSSESAGLAHLLERHAERPPADAVIAILGALPRLEADEAAIARFLLAGALSELGLVELAAGILRPELDSPFLGGAAFVAWLRAESAAGEHERIVRVTRRAPWKNVAADDLGEALYRAARACFVTARYPEARLWAREVPDDSSWHPFARYLLAQSEYALGRHAAALSAAEPIFSSRDSGDAVGALQERTAVLLGDMLIEIGLYERAVEVLSWPDADGPFAERAGRDRLVARGLAALEAARFERAEALTARVAARLDRLGADIERASASTADRAARIDDLRRAWPAAADGAARRRWTAARARDAWERSRGWTFSRVMRAAWASFPPVILWRLARRPDETVPEGGRIGADSRFFFAPRPEVSKLLAAAALLEESGERDCREAAVHRRAAAALLGVTPIRDLESLRRAECDDAPNADSLAPVLRERLDHALEADARRQLRALREQRFALDEAVARARLDHQAAIRAVESRP